MKKLFLAAIIICYSFSIFAQDESKNTSTYYWINGISSKEDIGGVDVAITKVSNGTKVVIINYNASTVTVSYEIKNINNDILIGSRVLEANESKTIADGDSIIEVKTVTRKLIGTTIEDNSSTKPAVEKSLKVGHYIAIAIGLICLIFIFIGYREVRQQSKLRKKLKTDPNFLKNQSLSQLAEFISTDMYFITEEEKELLNYIIHHDYDEYDIDLNEKTIILQTKIKELIQDTSGIQVVVYASVIIIIAVTILILFRLDILSFNLIRNFIGL